MTLAPLRTEAPVLLVGAAPLAPGLLEQTRRHASVVVAADGGARAALAAGLMPERVIGDLDSLDAASAARLEGRIMRAWDQDRTDFEKCLSLIEAPLVLGVGFLGGRVDHAMAALGALVAHGARRIALLGEADVAMHLGAPLSLDLPVGTRVSLMPLAPVRVASEGLRWPTDGVSLSPAGRTGCSNAAVGPVRLVPEGPGAILVLERAVFGALMEALKGAASTEP